MPTLSASPTSFSANDVQRLDASSRGEYAVHVPSALPVVKLSIYHLTDFSSHILPASDYLSSDEIVSMIEDSHRRFTDWLAGRWSDCIKHAGFVEYVITDPTLIKEIAQEVSRFGPMPIPIGRPFPTTTCKTTVTTNVVGGTSTTYTSLTSAEAKKQDTGYAKGHRFTFRGGWISIDAQASLDSFFQQLDDPSSYQLDGIPINWERANKICHPHNDGRRCSFLLWNATADYPDMMPQLIIKDDSISSSFPQKLWESFATEDELEDYFQHQLHMD